MRRFLVILAIALVVAAAAGAGALAVRTLTHDHAPPAAANTPTKAQLAARKRLTDELTTYGCACQHHEPPAKPAPYSP